MAESFMEGYGIKIGEIIGHIDYEKILPFIAKDLNRDPDELRKAANGKWCDDGESLVSMYENDVFVGKVIADIANRKDGRMVLYISKDTRQDVYCVIYPQTVSLYPWETEDVRKKRAFITKEDFTNVLKSAIRDICDDDVIPDIRNHRIYFVS